MRRMASFAPKTCLYLPILPLSAPADGANIEVLSLDAVIHHHVQYVLDLNHGNKLRTARQLGISRSTLYRILGNEAVLAR